MIAYVTLVAALYALMVLWQRNHVRVLITFAFVITSFLLRFEVDSQLLRDFAPYFASFQAVKYDAIPVELLIEPYRLILFQFILLFGDFDDLSQISAIYYLHFAIVTAFFVWLAWLKDVTFEIKLILFLAFYPSIALVWLRSGMAYIAAGYLLYTIRQGRWQFLQFILPAFHVSALLILVAKKTQEFRSFYKFAALAILAVVTFLAFETSYGQYIQFKLERYSETSSRRTSTNLLLFHAVNVLTVLYLALINTRFRKSFVLRVLFGAYLVFYFVNPVIGLRIFPYILIAAITERIAFTRYPALMLIIVSAYFPVYFFRFDQIFL